MTKQRIFDGHNDVLSCLRREGEPAGEAFFSGRSGNLDLQKCRAGGFAGGFFAVWCSNDPATAPDPMAQRREFTAIDSAAAHVETAEQIAILLRMVRARPDAISLCRNVAEIAAAEAAGAIAALLHIEGCEGIGAGLDELHVYHAAGLRSLGPVWSRPNIFGHGVPFDFPASPDIGPGLSDAGKRLVADCDQLGILFDLSHLNEAGFWDVARLSTKPLVATHSGAHAITPATRNLTDKQLDAIAQSGGLVGLNFGCQFVRADGVKISATAPAEMLRHLDHLLAKLGEDGVALGSDFDGAMMPDFIGDAASLPKLIAAMQDAGYGPALIDKICWQNWMRVLSLTIG
ncbi:MAG: dipeptidase [Cypionkella sp.]